jgi:transcriptional regulator with XRE-family HTH domain
VAKPRIQVDGSKVKEAREAKRWSQETLAKKTGYKTSVIQKFEQGTYFSWPCLKRVADVLDVQEDDLLVTPPRPGVIRPPSGPTVYCGPAKLRERHALDDGGVRELTKRCYYKIEGATLKIDETEARLIIKKVTMYDDRSCSKERSSHRFEGHGSYVDRSASIEYTVTDQTGLLSWAGVCLLRVPQTGKIRGHWMARGHDELRTVLGTFELDPKPLVKSSEEPGDHGQREG